MSETIKVRITKATLNKNIWYAGAIGATFDVVQNPRHSDLWDLAVTDRLSIPKSESEPVAPVAPADIEALRKRVSELERELDAVKDNAMRLAVMRDGLVRLSTYRAYNGDAFVHAECVKILEAAGWPTPPAPAAAALRFTVGMDIIDDDGAHGIVDGIDNERAMPVSLKWDDGSVGAIGFDTLGIHPAERVVEPFTAVQAAEHLNKQLRQLPVKHYDWEIYRTGIALVDHMMQPITSRSFEDAAKEFQFADGTPFGVVTWKRAASGKAVGE